MKRIILSILISNIIIFNTGCVPDFISDKLGSSTASIEETSEAETQSSSEALEEATATSQIEDSTEAQTEAIKKPPHDEVIAAYKNYLTTAPINEVLLGTASEEYRNDIKYDFIYLGDTDVPYLAYATGTAHGNEVYLCCYADGAVKHIYGYSYSGYGALQYYPKDGYIYGEDGGMGYFMQALYKVNADKVQEMCNIYYYMDDLDMPDATTEYDTFTIEGKASTKEQAENYLSNMQNKLGMCRTFNYNNAFSINDAYTEEGASAQPSNNQAIDIQSQIDFIRKTYAYTNEHIAEYTKTNTPKENDYHYNSNASQDIYYSGDTIVKRVIYDTDITVEAYYLNPALGDAKEGYSPVDRAIFSFAYDKNGNEYRLYYKDALIIRYIGPDHAENDYDVGLSFLEFCASMGYPVSTILSDTSPVW